MSAEDTINAPEPRMKPIFEKWRERRKMSGEQRMNLVHPAFTLT